ncbi:MAG TPA: NAD-glutamate dehydrogenase domain-containing protein [Candidatus Binataceae bacterium]|nr:NAD-glutamate dehydrogenase domain-containing protein [Candidatus Binataceae bacterium]
MSNNAPVEQAQGNHPGAERTRSLSLFAERLFARLPSDLESTFPRTKRAVIAGDAFDFFSQRSEPVKVRAFAAPGEEALIIVETMMADCPFIVDSIREYFRHREFDVRVLLHPVFHVGRDASGALLTLEQGGAAEHAESFTHTEVEAMADDAACQEIERDLARILGQVIAVTADFEAMTARALQICEETAAQRELVEVRDFLRWLVQGGFVFLGYRRYRIEPLDGQPAIATESGAGLGVMRADQNSRFARPTPITQLDDALRRLLFEGSALIVGKTHALSEVHRRAPMDDVTIRRGDAKGRAIGFDRFVGLFTSKAYAEEAEHIPLLRAKLRDLIAAEGLKPRTHDYKALVAAFNSFPKEELFRARTAELRQQLRTVLDTENEDEVRLSLESDTARGSVNVLVIMPRDSFSAEVRQKIQAALGKGLGGNLIYYYLALGEGYTARLHFSFAAPPPEPATVERLQNEVARLAQRWDELLRERLLERHGAVAGRELFARWEKAFSPQYRSSVDAETALEDIEEIERLGGPERFSVKLRLPADGQSAELRMYEMGEAPILSELIPMLQNFGISVISEEAHEFRLGGEAAPSVAHVQSFQISTTDGQPFSRKPGAGLIADALVAVRTGRAEDDVLNALVLEGALAWREVALVRAYLAAAFQMRLGPARPALRRPLLLCPPLAQHLVAIFRERFDPDRESSAATVEEHRRAYLGHLASIENIADDRVARQLLAMVMATTRTNFFRDDGAPYIALKFASGQITGLPDVPPLFEIHVDSPTMEGCHLRSGRIARGGIRHSDRLDDYRTEILDLMKTQTVKNAIIVPTGAKGGFVIKPRGSRPPDAQAAQSAYTTLINGMLDLTDNIVNGQVVHPPRVKVYDDDGPYLVVAADKGTATFSDLANSIAEQREFWLGDAFASGGAHGYDHKQLGITARGAWESARRHLREIGRDPDRGAPITMIGIGDMSGDVFGNGLLLSTRIKLIAAFDHRHIFIDPDPDPERSFAERKRLFEMPRSQWSDYDPALISPGGGVYRRGQKRIQLSVEARRALACNESELDAEHLVQAILRAPVDMLYNGGIGTYVRASDETDAEVGDHANDPCRIAAAQLRCRIVVEGGNLGFTQKARIEYALGGGRINTDAIDNSAGVDMSDHEVNLKILLQPAVARGEISETKRNRILADAGAEVAADVLRDNRDQALLLTLEERRSRTELMVYREHVTALEQRGVIRLPEAIVPPAAELQERRAHFPGLTRPELALVTAFTKIDLSNRLLNSRLIDDPDLDRRFLHPYFPLAIARAFAGDLPHHRLRRELVATRVVNELVDLMGSVFIFNLERDFGVEIEDAIRSWLIASGILDLRARVSSLHDRSEKLGADEEIGAFRGLARPTRQACAWALFRGETAAEISATVARFKPAFDDLVGHFEHALMDGERERFELAYREMRNVVHEEELALQLSRLSFAGHLLNVLSLAFERGANPVAMAEIYFGLERKFEFSLIENALDAISTEDRWERRAVRDLRAELTWARSQLCCAAFAERGEADHREADARGARRAGEISQLMRDLRSLPAIGLPPLQVTVRALARLASGA